MFNFRKPLILTGLYLTGSNIPRYLKEIKRVSQLPPEEIKKYQEEKLRNLLWHAYNNVPYYHRILPESGVISNGEIYLENFQKIPILTKEIIRSHFNELTDSSALKRDIIHNFTGGSTGEPLHFFQDRNYTDWNYANKIFYCSLAGKEIGQLEMKIWGSERDILESKFGITKKIQFFLYGRIFENSFNLTDITIQKIIRDINYYKPSLIWGYVNSLHILSDYVIENKISFHSPVAVLSTSGTLTEDIRNRIRIAFGSKVLNVYGSREVGDIACEEEENHGLSIFQHSHFVEVEKGETNFSGEILITSLHNYAMPFIRYQIGDFSDGLEYLKTPKTNFLKLKNVVGRSIEIFRTKENKFVPPEFFIHIVGVVYNSGFIKKFQVIQKEVNRIVIKIILGKERNETNLKKIQDAIKIVMGRDCIVEYEFVDTIAPNNSGKYQYTVCEIRDDKK